MFGRLQLSTVVIVALVGPALASSEDVTMVSCSVCHGLTGSGASIPTINGRDSQELLALMLSFAAGDTSATIMHRFLAGMSSEELELLAVYISGMGAAE